MPRLPIPGSDKGQWGNILNEYLAVEHNPDGTLRPSGSLGSRAPLNNPTFTGTVTVPTPTTATDAVTKGYVDGLIGTSSLPSGGGTNQVLAKASATDYDTQWVTPPSAPVASVNGQTGAVTLDPDDLDDTSTTHKFASSAELSKLAGIQAGAEVNVNADWSAGSGDAQILNKPSLGTAAAANTADFATAAQGTLADSAVQSDDLADVATSGDYTDLSNTPAIPDSADDVGAVANVKDVTGLWHGTESEYAAIISPDPNTVYIVVADP